MRTEAKKRHGAPSINTGARGGGWGGRRGGGWGGGVGGWRGVNKINKIDTYQKTKQTKNLKQERLVAF